MKKSLRHFGLLLVVIGLATSAAWSANIQIGSIARIEGKAELRAGLDGDVVPLDAQRDERRPLYAGDQLRCEAGGRVTLDLLMNRTNVVEGQRWISVPDFSEEHARWLTQQWLADSTVAARRTRGDAPRRRAVLVGINVYRPANAAAVLSANRPKAKRGDWQNLDGCVNDVEAVRSLLISRFGFQPADIVVLTDQQATRAAILKAFNTHLLATSRPGDSALFFYAGHGSQIVNSKSSELDRRDETIVPADSWLGEPDIRDKELRRLFNALLDRGAVLTAIFDSCHSGSVARGNFVAGKSRHAAPILEDIADPTDFGTSPEARGALVLAAAQDDQPAEEQSDGSVPHGAFSSALIKVLRDVPITTSASQLFLSVKAALQSGGRLQEPVLAGNDLRRRMGLFGENGAGLSNRTVVAVERVASSGEVRLQGGRALGLIEGCQLQRLGSGTPTRLEITSVEGLARSGAKVIEGKTEEIRPGDVFEVKRWVYAPEAMLRVWMPPATLSENQWTAALELAAQLQASSELAWVEDPTATSPTHILSWDGRSWNLARGNASPVELGGSITATQVLAQIREAGGRPRLFLAMPPSKALRDSLRLGPGTANENIEIVSAPAAAQYLLVGRVKNGQAGYAWVIPNAAESDAERMPLPLRSDWFPINGQSDQSLAMIGRQLEERVLRLGKVKSWLTLSSPPGGESFPYRLAFSNAVSGASLNNDVQPDLRGNLPEMRGRESYQVLLRAEPEALKAGIGRRYVYVFALDSAGQGTLVWPDPKQGNIENRLPPANTSQLPKVIPLRWVTNGPPYGIDTYFVLTSLQTIDPSAFQFEGVRGGETTGTRGSASPLERLLSSVGSATRGLSVEAPVDWSIQKTFIRSVPR